MSVDLEERLERCRLTYGAMDDENLGGEDEAPRTISSKNKQQPLQQIQELDKSDIFPWAELPAELRNKIYGLCLTTGEPISIEGALDRGSYAIKEKSQWPWDLGHNQRRRILTRLLLLNRATYAEARSMLYENEFEFYSARAMSLFLDRLSPEAKSCIKRVTFTTASRSKAPLNIMFGCLESALQTSARSWERTIYSVSTPVSTSYLWIKEQCPDC